jgi:hypothetical protein
VIPAILPSAKATPKLPLLLQDLNYVDFRVVTPLDPLKQLIWGITGVKPSQQSDVSSQGDSAAPEADVKGLIPPKDKTEMELTLGERNIDRFSQDEQQKFLDALSKALALGFEIRLKRITAGSIRLRLELSPEDADKVYAATQKGQLAELGISQARLYPGIAVPPDGEQRSQLLVLLNRVNETWVEGVLKNSLHDEVLISLGKRPMEEAVEPPWKHVVELSSQRSQLLLQDRKITTIFDATGLLLILGEPGSGKTTTLLELASNLIARAKADAKERVPVVLNLSSWKKKQPLVEWISGELSEKYRVPKKIARFWLQNNYLLPLLDGLDEVNTALQPDCVAAINTFIEEFNPSGLVACCRLNEYRWLPERLKLNGAICLEPLSKDEVDQYLARSGPKLATLREAVETDSVLQELARTPVMLSIMSLAFQGAGSNELAAQKLNSLEERRKQIFGLYVEQMFQRKGATSLVFPTEKTIGWLSWLAGKMREHSQSVFLVEELQPSWLGTSAQRGAYGTVAALSFGLLVGLVFGLVFGLSTEAVGLFPKLLVGLVFGPAVLVGVRFGCWSESSLKNGLISGPIIGLSFGLSFGLLVELLFRPPSGLSFGFGLEGGLLFGLTGGLIGGLGVGSLNHITLVETMSWKWNQFWERLISSWESGLRIGVRGLLSGALVGALVGLVVGLVGAAKEGPIFAVLVGATVGLVVGLLFGLPIWVIVGLVTGWVGGFADTVKTGKASPNQGIKLSRKNALTAFLVTWLLGGLLGGLIFGLIFGLIGLRLSWQIGLDGLIFGLINGLIGGLIVGLIVGLIGGLNRGGSAAIKHYALRLILWLNGYTPFNFTKFLDHCARLILLKKVGGGYIFIHRMLLEYFADLPAIEKPDESKST